MKLKFGDPESIAYRDRVQEQAVQEQLKKELGEKLKHSKGRFCPDCGVEGHVSRILDQKFKDREYKEIMWETDTCELHQEWYTDLEGERI